MASGFNTDVQTGERVFHVQTEDRGPGSPVIDTVVYQNGRVVLRRSSNYAHFAASDEFDPDDLRERVVEQHRCVIGDLYRVGEFDADIASAIAGLTHGPASIELLLLNPGSWLSAGRISLEVEVRRRADGRPEAGIVVEAVVEGAMDDERHAATSDAEGRVRIEFLMPKAGTGELALVILAKTDSSNAELRYALRSRPKSPQAGAAQ